MVDSRNLGGLGVRIQQTEFTMHPQDNNSIGRRDPLQCAANLGRDLLLDPPSPSCCASAALASRDPPLARCLVGLALDQNAELYQKRLLSLTSLGLSLLDSASARHEN